MATGKDLARAIRATRGPVMIPVILPDRDVLYVAANKTALAEMFASYGDTRHNDETGLQLSPACDQYDACIEYTDEY